MRRRLFCNTKGVLILKTALIIKLIQIRNIRFCSQIIIRMACKRKLFAGYYVFRSWYDNANIGGKGCQIVKVQLRTGTQTGNPFQCFPFLGTHEHNCSAKSGNRHRILAIQRLKLRKILQDHKYRNVIHSHSSQGLGKIWNHPTVPKFIHYTVHRHTYIMICPVLYNMMLGSKP